MMNKSESNASIRLAVSRTGKSGLDSPKSNRSGQSNDKGDRSVTGGMSVSSSIGASSFLRQAKDKTTFASALEEAKQAFKEEEKEVSAGSVSVKTGHDVKQGGYSVNSVTSVKSTKIVN
jgi:hypothetical protein